MAKTVSVNFDCFNQPVLYTYFYTLPSFSTVKPSSLLICYADSSFFLVIQSVMTITIVTLSSSPISISPSKLASTSMPDVLSSTTQGNISSNNNVIGDGSSNAMIGIGQMMNQSDDFFFKLHDYLLKSLIEMPPEYYNVDSIIERMPSQIMTQTQFRYLIKNYKNASPSMLFKFNINPAFQSSQLSSLAASYLKKMMEVINPSDFNALIPEEIEFNRKTDMPLSSPPIDDSMLEIIRPFIAKQLFEYTPKSEIFLSSFFISMICEMMSNKLFSI